MGSQSRKDHGGGFAFKPPADLHQLWGRDPVFQTGVAPNRIDLPNDLTGITFEETWADRVTTSLFGSLPITVIGKAAYLKNKRASGRFKDLADVKDAEGLSDEPD
ncbi:MAG: hypothetical protein VKP57_08550 [Candidatus Sericytochromatia bacterium]|nr:hypothetical protein [Candidatus Sericytochromatia bacterium]